MPRAGPMATALPAGYDGSPQSFGDLIVQLNGIVKISASFFFCSALTMSFPVFGAEGDIVLKTIADAPKGKDTSVDLGAPGPSAGDMFVFDEPLVDEHHRLIGNNGGFCITVRLNAFSQCQWTLQLRDGTITVGGQEAQSGPSTLPVVGTTGAYQAYAGTLLTQPLPDGTFSQVITLHRTGR